MKLFKRNKKIIRNKKLNKARFLYLYIIFGSILGFIYFFFSLFMGWAKHFAFTPFYLIIVFAIIYFFIKNWLELWFYITNVNRGKLLLYLDKATHWTKSHKIKVVKWIYLGSNRVRKQTALRIANSLMNGQVLTNEEKKILKHKTIFPPQEILIGFNEALLVNAAIYAHRNIKPLDDEIRDILNLTDENIIAFNIMDEYKKAGGKEYDRLMEIGLKNSKN